MATLSYVASNYLNSGKTPKRLGNAHPNIVPYQDFQASDGYLAFAAGNDLQWGKFCRAVGHDDWVEDERFATNPKRVENREVLIPLLDEVFSRRSVDEWLARCDEIGIPAAPINTVEDAFIDPQSEARDLIFESALASGDPIRMPGSPLKILESPPEVFRPPPELGQHNQEILSELLGYSDEDIQGFEQDEVI